jgi:hypothetical protein
MEEDPSPMRREIGLLDKRSGAFLSPQSTVKRPSKPEVELLRTKRQIAFTF